MRISDWSSDVCSSDLSVDGRDQPEISRVRTSPMIRPARTRKTVTTNMTAIIVARVVGGRSGLQQSPNGDRARSEARSFGAVVPAGSPFAKADDTRWGLWGICSGSYVFGPYIALSRSWRYEEH